MATIKEKKGNPIISYLEASYQEIRKVAWPTRNQAVRLTFLVLGFVVVVAAVVGLLDYVFGTGHRALLDLAPERALPTTVEQGQTEQTLPIDLTGNGAELPEGAIDVGDVTVGGENTGDVSVTTEAPAPETAPVEGPSA